MNETMNEGEKRERNNDNNNGDIMIKTLSLLYKERKEEYRGRKIYFYI